MKEILRNIDLIGLFILFVATVFYILRGSKCKSTAISAGAVVVFGGFMTLITPHLHELQSLFDKNTVRFIWFSGFSALDLLVVLSIGRAHRKYNVKYSEATRYTVIGFSALAICHFPTYLDHQIFKSGMITTAYTYAIPSINIVISISLVLGIVKEDFKKWMS